MGEDDVSIFRAGRGNSATCDGPPGLCGPLLCDECVIDLSRRADNAARVLRTFFGWSTALSGGRWIVRCPRCREKAPRMASRPGRRVGGFWRMYQKQRGLKQCALIKPSSC